MIEILADLDYFLDEQDGSWLNFQFFASFFFFLLFFFWWWVAKAEGKK